MKTTATLLVILMLGGAAHAGRTSANYSIPSDALDFGGRSSASATYKNVGSAGLIAGSVRSASGTVMLASGYVPQAGALQVVNVVSNKVHGAAGTFPINLPLTGLPGIECRTGGPTGDHQVVVTFAAPVSVGGISLTSRDGLASATKSVSGAVVTLNLTAVANAQTLGITLLNVSNGATTANVFVPMGVLLGDTNNDGLVNSGDAIQTRSRSGQPTSSTNFRSDFNIDGSINSGDSIIVRARSGSALP